MQPWKTACIRNRPFPSSLATSRQNDPPPTSQRRKETTSNSRNNTNQQLALADYVLVCHLDCFKMLLSRPKLFQLLRVVPRNFVDFGLFLSHILRALWAVLVCDRLSKLLFLQITTTITYRVVFGDPGADFRLHFENLFAHVGLFVLVLLETGDCLLMCLCCLLFQLFGALALRTLLFCCVLFCLRKNTVRWGKKTPLQLWKPAQAESCGSRRAQPAPQSCQPDHSNAQFHR